LQKKQNPQRKNDTPAGKRVEGSRQAAMVAKKKRNGAGCGVAYRVEKAKRKKE